ncbi:MAG: glutamate--tRNA ligase family protein [Imperialibacter sp.]|uniref:glutamate--tRNA ligase family protein n=1 Tax=Imperialibacter sp. TaxID=2038411 RepID=UPI0032EFB816
MNRLQKLQLPAPITRFAPTPSGFLHIGNIYSFLFTWLLARKNNGQILLRIDDLDQERVKPEYVENIFRTLEWLGLDWDLGPFSVQQFEKEYSQLQRMELYEAAFQTLEREGAVFGCDCSRKLVKKLIEEHNYEGICQHKGLELHGHDISWRLKTDGMAVVKMKRYKQGLSVEELPYSQSHFVVRRRDGIPAYHLASVVDDGHFGVNTIVRGEDLFESSVAQLYLAEKLGLTAFSEAEFFHHPLIMGGGVKLSKSQRSSAVLDEFSQDKPRLLRKLGSWLALPPEACGSLDELLKAFSFKRVGSTLSY